MPESTKQYPATSDPRFMHLTDKSVTLAPGAAGVRCYNEAHVAHTL